MRCGSCQEVFDATQHLFKNLTEREPITDFQLKPEPTPAAPGAPSAPASQSAVTEDIDLSVHMPPPTPTPTPTQTLDEIRREREAAPDQQHFMESTIGNTRYNNLDEIGAISIPGDIDFGDSIIQFPDEQEESAPEKIEVNDGTKGSSSQRTPYEDLDDKETTATDADHDSIKDFYAQVDAQLHQDPNQADTDIRSQLDKDIDELLAFSKKLDTNSNQLRSTHAPDQQDHVEIEIEDEVAADSELEDEFDFKVMADIEKEIETKSPAKDDEEDPASEFALADTPEDLSLEEDTDTNPFEEHDKELHISDDIQIDEDHLKESTQHDDDIPRALRQSLDMLDQRPRRSLGKTILLSLVTIILIAGLGFQTILFRDVELAHAFPKLIPILNEVCDKLPCRYSGKKDVSQIKLVNRDVRSDPNHANALLISATFVDEASFDQPYPDILITLYDLGGNVVASRRFTPKEYLASMYNRFLLMESGTPVRVTLAVLDPGKDAINFEFSFQ